MVTILKYDKRESRHLTLCLFPLPFLPKKRLPTKTLILRWDYYFPTITESLIKTCNNVFFNLEKVTQHTQKVGKSFFLSDPATTISSQIIKALFCLFFFFFLLPVGKWLLRILLCIKSLSLLLISNKKCFNRKLNCGTAGSMHASMS